MVNKVEKNETSRKTLSAKSFTFTTQEQQFKKSLNNNGITAIEKYNNVVYEPYLDDQEVKDGLEKGILIKGVLRVNQRNYEQCFIDNPDGVEQSDLLILGTKDRNRAFHGDLVVVRLKPKTSWFIHESFVHKYKLKKCFRTPMKEGSRMSEYKLVNYHQMDEIEDWTKVPEEHLKKTCQIVTILEKSASRRVVGHIKPMQYNVDFFIFAPIDSRIPRLLIPSKKAPTGFYERPQDYENYIYLGELDEWPIDSKLPHGKLLDNLGLAGEVDTEHKALIRVNAIDERDYESYPEVFKGLPIPETQSGWTIPPEEFDYRRDFRNENVITIDPSTARDLDDALHIERTIWNGPGGKSEECWEVGVHIADVAYFLKKGTTLDEWAFKRGTSVIPMLPRILCEELCSLNPGVDRLTFSVVWLMDDEAKILDIWFGRSIIQSCAKLSYEHAQDIIDNPTKQFAISEMPPIHSGRKIRDVKTTVKNLNQIAKKLKAKRFREGALKLDLPKLRFDLEKNDSGIWQPRGIRLDQRKDANFLVEEFMLLANMEVARRLHNYFKGKALLRRHPSPKKKELNLLVERCRKLGIQLNSLTSKTLADSITNYEHREEYIYTVLPALNQMLMKCMHLAQYFCTGTVESTAEFHHYALSVSFYTHFTSPIRRYPDVIVHRLLAASLQYSDDPGYSIKQLDQIALRANQTKATAKLCSETSADIFFGALVRESGNFEALGVVMAIFDQSFDFLLLKYAIVKRVYLKKQKWLDQIYFGKLEVDGPISLVLHIKEGHEESKKLLSKPNGKIEEKMVDVEEDDENDVEISEIEVPSWVRESRPEQLQTLNIMSVAKFRLVPLKNSVKYEAYLIPTPDSSQLNLIDAKEYMEDLSPNLGNIDVLNTKIE